MFHQRKTEPSFISSRPAKLRKKNLTRCLKPEPLKAIRRSQVVNSWNSHLFFSFSRLFVRFDTCYTIRLMTHTGRSGARISDRIDQYASEQRNSCVIGRARGRGVNVDRFIHIHSVKCCVCDGWWWSVAVTHFYNLPTFSCFEVSSYNVTEVYCAFTNPFAKRSFIQAFMTVQSPWIVHKSVD